MASGCRTPRYGSSPMLLIAGLALVRGLDAQTHVRRASYYELTLIQPPGPGSSRATSVDETGRVTGTTATNHFLAFVWSPTTGRVDLAPLAGSQDSRTGDVAGPVVVGSSFVGPTYTATVWPGSGTPFAIPIPGASSSSAVGINHAGLIAAAATVNGQTTWWTWDPVHGASDLATYGLTDWSTVYAINELGQMAGGWRQGQGFLLDPSTSSVTYVGSLVFGGWSAATGLDDHGHLVGWASDWNLRMHPFFWTPEDGLLDLGSLAPPVTPESGSASAVNDDDVVVGWSKIDDAHSHAFVWDAASGMRDLNDLVHDRGPIRLVSASDISNRGWIVGDAVDTSAGNAQVAFVVRPR